MLGLALAGPSIARFTPAHPPFTHAEYSAPMSTLRILHLSDTHLFGDDSHHYGVVDTAEHLRLALAHVAGLEFDLVVCSGDVSEDGSLASYERAREMIGEWAADRGSRTLFVMGNHDSRAEFRAVLGSGQPGVDAVPFVRTATGSPVHDFAAPIASVATVDGWRTIVLDTSVPGAGYGELGEAQLAWLRGLLETPAEHGTVVVLHHPPLRAQTELLEALALDEGDARHFTEAIAGSDVRVVLAGHYHMPIVETLAGVPVVVAPGVTNLARAFEPPAEESAADEFGGVVVTVTAGGSAPGSVRALPFTQQVTEREVFHLGEELVREIIGKAGRQ